MVVTCPPDETKHLDYHHDTQKHASLLIELNNDYIGGEIVYLTDSGPIVQERFLGTGVIHGSEIVHGVLNHAGAVRYVFQVFSDVFFPGPAELDLGMLLANGTGWTETPKV